MAALGHAMNDATLEGFGRLLLAMEIHSAREYYHVRYVTRYLCEHRYVIQVTKA